MRPTTQQISQQPRQSTSYQFVPDLSEATVVGHPRPQHSAAHVTSTAHDPAPDFAAYFDPSSNRRFSAMSEKTQSTEPTQTPNIPAPTEDLQPPKPSQSLYSVTLPSTSTPFHLPGHEIADALETVLIRLKIWRLGLDLEVRAAANMVDKQNSLLQARTKVAGMLTEIEEKVRKAAGEGVEAGWE